MNIRPSIVAGTTLVLFAASTASADPTFTLIANLAGYDRGVGQGVSGDGSRVVGTAGVLTGSRAFAWDQVGGTVEVLGPAGTTRSNAFSISNAGDTIVGTYATNAHTSAQESAFIWTAGSGSVALPLLPGASSFIGSAQDVSGDGSVVAGMLRSSWNTNRAVFWKNAATPVDIGMGIARGASFDGSVIVGGTVTLAGSGDSFRWKESTGTTVLTKPTGYVASVANAVSADGTVIVGGLRTWDSALKDNAYRWTESTGMVALPIVAGWSRAIANAVSADGSVIVGHLESTVFAGTSLPSQAFYWSQATGMVTLRTMLGESVGAEWRLIEARDVSDDGLTVTGYVRSDLTGETRTFVAVVPAPASMLIPGAALAFASMRRRR
jgi:uncharacterized membrane protein